MKGFEWDIHCYFDLSKRLIQKNKVDSPCALLRTKVLIV